MHFRWLFDAGDLHCHPGHPLSAPEMGSASSRPSFPRNPEVRGSPPLQDSQSPSALPLPSWRAPSHPTWLLLTCPIYSTTSSLTQSAPRLTTQAPPLGSGLQGPSASQIPWGAEGRGQQMRETNNPYTKS